MTALKADHAVTVSPGSVTITDFDRLRRHECTCTDAVRLHFDTVLRNVYPREDG